MADTPDIVVVGAGPGGYVAAIRAAQLGKKVAIVERAHLGGICLNWGCIPTKALLTTGEVFELLSQLKGYGVTVEAASFDVEALVKRSRAIAQQLSSGVAFLMKKHKIRVVEGAARLEPSEDSSPLVIVEQEMYPTEVLAPETVILATGARARTLPHIGLEADGKQVLTYREAMVPERIPASMLIVGGGAIGIEFASFYRALGAQVTVIESLNRILPNEDSEISAAAQKALEKRGIKFKTGATVNGAERAPDSIALGITDSIDGEIEWVRGDVVLLAAGVVPNTENLGLELLGMEFDHGNIKVGEYGETNVRGLYAIGDVAGAPWLAHKASHEGVRCIEHLAGLESPIRSPIPACTYSNPQIASVGLTAEQATAQHGDIRIGRFPFKFNGRALSAGYTEGFVKTIFEASTGRLLGAHMIGAEVTELIHSMVLALALGATEETLAHVMFPHPTLSEVLHESTLSSQGMALHM